MSQYHEFHKTSGRNWRCNAYPNIEQIASVPPDSRDDEADPDHLKEARLEAIDWMREVFCFVGEVRRMEESTMRPESRHKMVSARALGAAYVLFPSIFDGQSMAQVAATYNIPYKWLRNNVVRFRQRFPQIAGRN